MNGITARQQAGLLGPVAVFGCVALLVLSPVVRGGDYFFALIPLEILGACTLAALGMRRALSPSPANDAAGGKAVAWLLASPLLIAIFQLVPLPPALWSELPGHARYVQALASLGLDTQQWRPSSISPGATRASLLAAIPLVAVFLAGYVASVRQYRAMIRVVSAIALLEAVLGLMQLYGGEFSPFYFGMLTYGSPIGTFGTRNEYANYLALALAGYIWLAHDSLRHSKRADPGRERHDRFSEKHQLVAWAVGGLAIVIGVLISHSRAGLAFGLSAALLGVIAACLRSLGMSARMRIALPLALLLLAGAGAMVGFDFIASRISGAQLQSSAGFRGELWRTSMDAAFQFLPLGSGWGTYDIAYRPFQSMAIVGYPNHAHNDYVEMFLEGGVLFLVPAALFAWLVAARAVHLARTALAEGTLDRGSMLAAIAGIGLAGFLLHAFVDFPMRVPANAILAAFFAGAFLRPLDRNPTPSNL